jgi:hypothetical protein
MRSSPHCARNCRAGCWREHEGSNRPYDRGDKTDRLSKTMAEQVKAVNVALTGVEQPVTAADVAKAFTRVKAGDVGEILETLCTMGHARRGQAAGTFLP